MPLALEVSDPASAAGAYEALADDLTRQVKAGLAADLAVLYPQMAA